MELLLRIAKEVAGIDSLDELLTAIVEISAKETGGDRGTLFLNDAQSGELYSRIAQGNRFREIRILNNQGIAGHVFTTGQGVIVEDAYADPRFDRTIDEETGYVTQKIVCAPIRTVKGEIIGVLQVLNKKHGMFTTEDLRLLEAMARETAITLRNTQFVESMKTARDQEMKFLDLLADITSDFDLSAMLSKIVTEAAKMLRADRATLFLNDEKTKELFSRVAMGDSVGEIRLPNHVGIAGAVFTSGQTVNIPYAYADLRFNPAFDKKTGYFTRSILCVPIANKAGKIIGVTQVLNKRGGPFNEEDEARLKAFTAQLAISLENAKLFDDVQNVKNYNESMLQSMSNGVVTLSEDGRIVTCNLAGLRILRVTIESIRNKPAAEFFTGPNSWIVEKIKAVEETLKSEISMDAQLNIGQDKVSVNLTVLPLMTVEDNSQKKKLGSLLMIEDISANKRMKATMSRYMDATLADQLLADGEEALGGKSVTATVLFSDVRNFTGITEELGAQGTVGLLNEYFTVMVECIQKQGGMLDKFIGDAIMAVFGLPIPHDDDEDRAVRSAIAMITELARWNEGRVSAGKKPVDMGIGLNTDIVVSGNIGSPKRMDYTIIGDGVNLASRLESACKQYSARILISEHTLRKLRGTYRVREVDYVVVKGKQEPVAVYEVLDYYNEKTFPNLLEVVNYFKGGLAYYRKAEWDKAIDTFRGALALNPSDKLPQIYIDRCEQLKATPPGDNWNGIWIMKSK
jgi:Adenylate cyclase, family 3 (some proteins contain HAMP domain)